MADEERRDWSRFVGATIDVVVGVGTQDKERAGQGADDMKRSLGLNSSDNGGAKQLPEATDSTARRPHKTTDWKSYDTQIGYLSARYANLRELYGGGDAVLTRRGLTKWSRFAHQDAHNAYATARAVLHDENDWKSVLEKILGATRAIQVFADDWDSKKEADDDEVEKATSELVDLLSRTLDSHARIRQEFPR